MKTEYRYVVVSLLAGSVAAGLFAVEPPATALAQTPQARQLEYRVDNTVRERGTVESARSREVRCEVAGGSTILFIVPEGSRVEKGDLLVELDDSALREKVKVAEIEAEQAKAAILRARADVKAANLDREAVLSVLEKELRVAETSRQRALGEGGELACQLAAIDSELAIAKERLRVAKQLITRAPGDRSGKQMVDLQLMMFEAQETIKVAETRKQFLEKHERAHQIAMLNLELARRQMELARQKMETEKAIHAAEADLMAAEAAGTMQIRTLEQVKEQLSHCNIHAPQSGLVVYATTGASRTSRTAIEEGAVVAERQPIIRIPDMSKLQIRVYVNESRINRLQPGQSAKIAVDAFPNRQFRGQLVSVSNVPEPTSWLNADIKQYSAIVSIEEPADSLRIGMTALVEIDTSKQ